MRAHNLIIGGVVITLESAHNLTQDYEELGGYSLRRKLDGAAHVQSSWSKLRSIISGVGRLPEGLSGLSRTTAYTLACMAPRSIWSATTSATLPAARRSDVAPIGFAVVNGHHVRTPISIATNTVTFTAVTGASGYLVAYWPSISAYVSLTQKFDGRGIELGWTLTAEEA